MDKKHRQYTKLLDFVKLNEPNKISLQGQDKASKPRNGVKGNPSGYQELIVKLEKRISLNRSRNAAVWKSFVKKSENATKNKSDGKIKIKFEFNFIEQ